MIQGILVNDYDKYISINVKPSSNELILTTKVEIQDDYNEYVEIKVCQGL